MSYQTLELEGSLSLKPPVGSPSGQPMTLMSYSEKVPLERQLTTNMTLTSDSAASVSLGTLTGVNCLSIRAVGGKVRLRVTSADGSLQALPVDPIVILRCDSADITALDVTREAGIETEVFIVLGQKG